MLHTILSPGDSEGPKHNFGKVRIIIESDDHSVDKYDYAETQLEREFGEFEFYLVDVYKSDSPEIWQKWWANQLVGNGDGPWNSQKKTTFRLISASIDCDIPTWMYYLRRVRW